ncbi:MAG: hypothetical protein IPK10_14430 [Bacteroidetes bacterium]|nr:hypothetical protein [Bacteroidota bacterium]
MLKVYIENNLNFYFEISYIWSVFCRDQKIEFEECFEVESAQFKIGTHESCNIQVDEELILGIRNGDAKLKEEFIRNQAVFFRKDGTKDYLSSSFYILSCAQELNSNCVDEFGRFPFAESFQSKLNLERVDLVSKYFNKIKIEHAVLDDVSCSTDERSAVFISHDIDLIYGALLQDGFYCLKNGRIIDMFRVFFNHFFGTPSWFNFRKIVEIEKKFGFSSTFFWLAIKGKTSSGVNNADYDISKKLLQEELDFLDKEGAHHGIHKSFSDVSFPVEMKRIRTDIIANRYHYLGLNVHKDLIVMEEAGIKFSSRISFAEKPGFRSGYSKPYLPYMFESRRAARFVECPMNLMDTTYFNYLKKSSPEAFEDIQQFIDCHKYNSVISILWHNNYISAYKYKDYCLLFEKVLAYLKNNNFRCITPKEIVKEFKL